MLCKLYQSMGKMCPLSECPNKSCHARRESCPREAIYDDMQEINRSDEAKAVLSRTKGDINNNDVPVENKADKTFSDFLKSSNYGEQASGISNDELEIMWPFINTKEKFDDLASFCWDIGLYPPSMNKVAETQSLMNNPALKPRITDVPTVDGLSSTSSGPSSPSPLSTPTPKRGCFGMNWNNLNPNTLKITNVWEKLDLPTVDGLLPTSSGPSSSSLPSTSTATRGYFEEKLEKNGEWPTNIQANKKPSKAYESTESDLGYLWLPKPDIEDAPTYSSVNMCTRPIHEFINGMDQNLVKCSSCAQAYTAYKVPTVDAATEFRNSMVRMEEALRRQPIGGVGRREEARETRPEEGAGGYCSFCRTNSEDTRYYLTHRLKDAEGRVTCPVLRKHTCPVCRASGDRAHTKKYCPMLETKEKQLPLLRRLANGSFAKSSHHK